MNLKYLIFGGAGGCAEKCTSKQRKMVASFCEELLSENDFEAVLVNLCCSDWYQCFWGSSEDYHKDTGVVSQLTKAANFMAPNMKKHI